MWSDLGATTIPAAGSSDGREELVTEYLCDHSGRPNVATHVLGGVREVGVVLAICDERA
jgi:hypothetical protein